MKMLSATDFKSTHQYFASGATRSYQFRKNSLRQLEKAIKQYEAKIIDALYQDLKKSPEEAYTTEVGFVYAEISYAIKNLYNWMEPQKVRTPIMLFPSKSYILKDPLGIVLIIAPWNYPFQLLMAPLIGAIAGGNCALLKPSELASNTAAVVAEMIESCFKKEYVSIVEGDGATVVPFLMTEYKFDHVFFTGSINVGREIAKLAALKLVPTTLELGGKSPCIVDEDADINVAANRIAWGKFTNAGQTCVAPDYILVHESKRLPLITSLKKSIEDFYGIDPQQSADFGRIINEQRFDKLSSFLQQENVITGGQAVKSDLYIAPTLMDHVLATDPVMKEEIFGPILPILSFSNYNDALNTIRANEKPLALYIFTNNKKVEQLFLEGLSFGGGCVNNTLYHLANPSLPFGGVGSSGIGAYHGKFSFDTFTRLKPIMKTSAWFDPKIKYPPYKGKLSLLKKLFK